MLDPRAGVTTIPAALAARAASLRIGALILGDVALEDCPAEAGDFPPRLGADLLRRVRCRVVPEKGQVVVARPPAAAARPPRLGRRPAAQQ